MKMVFSGLESSGKSLRLAMLVTDLAWRNHKWMKRTGIVRPIHSNLHFSPWFENYCREELGVPINYWTDISELVKIRDADVIIDELATYFDARMWGELTLDARRWLAQGAKCGIEMYATAQDFAQVDKAFRRLVNVLYHITKVIGSPRPAATKPKVKTIWGICMVRELDPVSYEEDNKKSIGIFPSFFFIRKECCSVFDTKEKIERSRLMPFRHDERLCEMDFCGFKKIVHA